MKAFMRAVLPAIAMLAAAGCGGGGGSNEPTQCEKLCVGFGVCAGKLGASVTLKDLLPAEFGDVTPDNCSTKCQLLEAACTNAQAFLTCANAVTCEPPPAGSDTKDTVKTQVTDCVSSSGLACTM